MVLMETTGSGILMFALQRLLIFRSLHRTPSPNNEMPPISDGDISNERGEPHASGSNSSEPASPVDPSVQAEELKEEGNVAFRKKSYGTAIDLYSQAIGMLSPLTLVVCLRHTFVQILYQMSPRT